MKDTKSIVYEDLKTMILTLELRPDELLDETSVSERYSLSRTPMRDILRRLEGEGYVDIRENRGTRVVPMDSARLRGFFQAAPVIYSAISRLAVYNYTRLQMDELVATQERYRLAIAERDVAGIVLGNNLFHSMIGRMADNKYFQSGFDRLLIDHARIGSTVYRAMDEEASKHLEHSCFEHDQIIDSIRRRDEDAVVHLVLQHLEPTRANIKSYIAPPSVKMEFFDFLWCGIGHVHSNY